MVSSYISLFSSKLLSTCAKISVLSRFGVNSTYRHNTALGLLDAFQDEHSAMFHSADSSTVDIYQVPSRANLSSLL